MLLFTANIYEISIVNYFIIIATVEYFALKDNFYTYVTSRFYTYKALVFLTLSNKIQARMY